MIGLIFIYWLGKYYYTLALKHDKNKWGYAILGVVTYYAGTLIGAMLVVLLIYFFNESAPNNISDNQLSLIGLPFGLLATWGLYQYLKKRWAKEFKVAANADVLDDFESIESNKVR